MIPVATLVHISFTDFGSEETDISWYTADHFPETIFGFEELSSGQVPGGKVKEISESGCAVQTMSSFYSPQAVEVWKIRSDGNSEKKRKVQSTLSG